MSRFDKYGDETLHSIYCRLVWSSPKISVEDKEWVDTISSKRNIKLSEQARLERLYEEAFGVKQHYPN